MSKNSWGPGLCLRPHCGGRAYSAPSVFLAGFRGEGKRKRDREGAGKRGRGEEKERDGKEQERERGKDGWKLRARIIPLPGAM